MSGKLTIQLTGEQQKQIKDATGKSITSLNIDLDSTGGLSEKDLDRASGGTNNTRYDPNKYST